MSVIHALHCLEPGHVLGKSSPGMSDSAGHCEKDIWEPRAGAEQSDSLALCCFSSIYVCCGTKCFV